MEPRLTIAIPVHAGSKWIDGIIDTVSKAPEWSRVVISDATHRDDAIGKLAEVFRDDQRVEVISRPESLDWIGHANRLLAEAGTEYFCWMPQDDVVSPNGYFELLVSALDRNPDRVLAFPTVVRKATVGRFRKRPVGEVAYQPPPIEPGQSDPAEEALRMLTEWNLALGCWRGVFRTAVARPAPETTDCADLIWAFSMALAGNFIGVEDARYLKRFHRGSALHSMRWQGMSSAMDLYRTEVEARLGSDPDEVERVMTEVHRYLRFRHRLIMFTLRYRPLAAFTLNRPRPVLE
ncbi:MAG: glycosyltransferase family 2 protein [Solirubrobacterales bacterium]|nr:glycosyltransferase family 2 protein [Solirubrobacterales bacterium]